MKRVLAVVVAAVLATIAAVPTGAAAHDRGGRGRGAAEQEQRKEQVDSQIRSLKAQVQEASQEEAALLQELDDAAAERRVLDKRVAALDQQVRAAQADLDAATQRLEQVEGELRRAEVKLSAAEGLLEEARSDLRARAVAAYVMPPGTQAAEVLLRLRSFGDLAGSQGYLDAVVDRQTEAIDRFRGLRDDLVQQRADLESTRADAAGQRDLVARRADDLRAARQAQDAARDEALGQERRYSALVARARSRVAEFESRIAALQRESDAIASLLRAAQKGQAFTGAKGLLGLPVTGARLSSRFGPRIHPILGTSRMHTGVDFAAPSGTPIRAAAAGLVLYSGGRGGYGLVTIIDHGGGLATLYAHQSRLLVAPGQRVDRGQVIGAVGSTGFSTGSHLHFEVRALGTPVDPLRYL